MSGNELYPDPLYGEPFVDVDEWRDDPVRHRYVHGGFTGTDLRFSVYFPPAEVYGGRFLQPLMHIAGDEHVAVTGELAGLGDRAIQFAFDSGGYLVESNQGSTLMMGAPDITGFRASAAAAQYSRVLAGEMYGDHRPYGYVTGGSGGAYKTMACYENAPDVWDGAVPFISGSHVSMPNVFTVQAHAFRTLPFLNGRTVWTLPGGQHGSAGGLQPTPAVSAVSIGGRMGDPATNGAGAAGRRSSPVPARPRRLHAGAHVGAESQEPHVRWRDRRDDGGVDPLVAGSGHGALRCSQHHPRPARRHGLQRHRAVRW